MTLRQRLSRLVAQSTQHGQDLLETTRDQADRIDLLERHALYIDRLVADLRELLPGEKKPMDTHEILEVFAERAVIDIGTLMAACIDYRKLLIRADVPDMISGMHGGIEAIMDKYGVMVEERKKGNDGHWWGAKNQEVTFEDEDWQYKLTTTVKEEDDSDAERDTTDEGLSEAELHWKYDGPCGL